MCLSSCFLIEWFHETDFLKLVSSVCLPNVLYYVDYNIIQKGKFYVILGLLLPVLISAGWFRYLVSFELSPTNDDVLKMILSLLRSIVEAFTLL
jgi:hypothetical protein